MSGFYEEIADGYLDVRGVYRSIDRQTRAALQEALGPIRTPFEEFEVHAQRCYQPTIFDAGGRVWGIAVQLYGLRSARNWGIGDFDDLLALVELAAKLGAATVGVNPLHAVTGPSPYAPSSRHALNVLYLSVTAIPEFSRCEAATRLVRSHEFRRQVDAARAAELVDYSSVRALKKEVFELLFKAFAARERLEVFRNSTTEGVRTYALFEALAEHFGDETWQGWPQPYRDPQSKEVREFVAKNAARVDFHLYLQWNARLQLDAVQRRASELGMPLGLYVDLALGAHSGGAEVWANQAGFAPGVSCGAPPDEFNPIGQDWGLPPYSPRALRAEQYRPFIELLRANMPEGGALRIDHVAWLFRLWWVPQSASGRSQPEKGGYVHYPPQELLAVLARESRGKRCMVVGEDLGTVPTEFRQALNQAGVLSYRPLMFEKASNGQFTPPTGYPRDALTCVSTHDLPTWQGFLAGRDLRIRAELGLLADPQNHFRYRKAETRRLLRALEREGLDLSTASVHRFLARTPCKIMTVQPEDAFGVVEQANLPGTVTEHPNWRRKLPVALERWGTDPRFAAIVDVVASERGRN